MNHDKVLSFSFGSRFGKLSDRDKGCRHLSELTAGAASTAAICQQ